LQGSGNEIRRIDVHQHFTSPKYSELLAQKTNVPVATQVLNAFRNYTPARNIEEMDKAVLRQPCCRRRLLQPGLAMSKRRGAPRAI
jgi:hypothetical protein